MGDNFRAFFIIIVFIDLVKPWILLRSLSDLIFSVCNLRLLMNNLYSSTLVVLLFNNSFFLSKFMILIMFVCQVMKEIYGIWGYDSYDKIK